MYLCCFVSIWTLLVLSQGTGRIFLWPHVAQFLRERDVSEFFWWCPLLPWFVYGCEWEGNLGSLKWTLRPSSQVSFPGSMHQPWCLWAGHKAMRVSWLSLRFYLFWLTLSIVSPQKREVESRVPPLGFFSSTGLPMGPLVWGSQRNFTRANEESMIVAAFCWLGDEDALMLG